MSDPVYTAPCSYCGSAVDPFARTTYRRIVGWERKLGKRASGAQAGSDITLREPRDEYACTACIDRLRRGIPAGQSSLL